MLKAVLQRLAATLPTLLALTLAVFLLVKLIPGDPAQVILGQHATKEALAEMRQQLGLDRPWSEQYLRFLKNLVVHGDLGRSAVGNERVAAVLAQKLPATCELAVAGMLFAILVGIPSGLLAAVWQGTAVDVASMALAMVGVSMPIFWLALVLTWAFGLQLGWLPISGRLGVEFYYEPVTGFVMLDAAVARDWAMLTDALRHLILPAVALGTIPMAFLARTTRSAMLDVIGQDYVRTAKAKGLSPLLVYSKHALKNAFLPVLTVLGLEFGFLLGGAIITETIFAWPGVGSWLLDSVASRDSAAIEGGVLAVAVAFVLVNLLTDLLYRVVDPRLRGA